MATSNHEGLRERRNGGTSPTSVITNSDDDQGRSNRKDKEFVVPAWKPDDKTLTEKLFSSKEEKSFIIPHIHKILGFSCLGSFIYRFTHLGANDGNFGPSFGTLAFIFHHWLLNASSFIFVIPRRRIRDGGFRIWPEYRIHSLVFASRSLAFMLLMWYEQMDGILPYSIQVYQHMDLIIVLATCACADFGSYLQGEHHSNTVRGATFADPFELWFASEMQLYLTAFCIIGYRRYTLHLLAVAVIQCNSFLMTLRRKNVAPHFVLTACYTLMLIGSFAAITYDDFFSHRTGVGATVGGIAALLRMGPLHVNKYVLWTGLWIVWYYVRNRGVLSFYNNIFWLYGLVITKTISTLLGLWKRAKAPKESKSHVVSLLIFVTHAALFGYLYWLNWIRRR